MRRERIELYGIFLAVPVTLVVSTVYCAGAASVLTKLRAWRPVALIGSVLVCLCILAEVVLLSTLGAKIAYSRLGVGFTAVHEISFWLGPPAIANLLLILLSVEQKAWKLTKITVATLICWIACMGAVVGNILIDEAIVGVDAKVPFYMTKPGSQTLRGNSPRNSGERDTETRLVMRDGADNQSAIPSPPAFLHNFPIQFPLPPSEPSSSSTKPPI